MLMEFEMENKDKYFQVGIVRLRKDSKKSQIRLAEEANTQRVTISQIETGSRPASLEAQWLLSKVFGMTPESVMALGRRLLQNESFEVSEEYYATEFSTIPVYNGGAGEPSGFSDQGYPAGVSDSYISIPKRGVDEHTFGVKIHGNSMAPHLNPGDVVIVVPSATLANGKLCFVTWPDDHGRRLVKRYFKYGNTIVLKSDNPDPKHKDIELNDENAQDVRIYRVTKSIREE